MQHNATLQYTAPQHSANVAYDTHTARSRYVGVTVPWLMWWGIRINDLVNAYRMSHELYLYGCARNSTYYHIKDATTAIVSWRTEWVTNSIYEWECAANSTHYHSNDVRPPPADVPWDPRQTWRCCDGFYTEWVTNSTYHYNKNVRPSPADVACDPHQRYGDRFRNNTERVTNSTYYYNKDVSPSMADVAWDPHQRRRDGFHKESVKNSTAENASRTEPIRMRHEPRILPHQLANAVIVSRSTASIANFTYEWEYVANSNFENWVQILPGSTTKTQWLFPGAQKLSRTLRMNTDKTQTPNTTGINKKRCFPGMQSLPPQTVTVWAEQLEFCSHK